MEIMLNFNEEKMIRYSFSLKDKVELKFKPSLLFEKVDDLPDNPVFKYLIDCSIIQSVIFFFSINRNKIKRLII